MIGDPRIEYEDLEGIEIQSKKYNAIKISFNERVLEMLLKTIISF